MVHHSHVLFLTFNRNMPEEDLKMAKTMRSAGIRICHIMLFMAQQVGKYENLAYIIKYLYNKIVGK